MQLPPTLRQAIEQELDGVALADLAGASERLSQRYRAETRDGRLHLDSNLATKAYLATRLPATYAAIAAALAATAEVIPDFAPQAMLDLGAGPGTATWAATSAWNSLMAATLLEASPVMRDTAKRLGAALPLGRVEWRAQQIDGDLGDVTAADLAVLAYVLDELAPATRPPLVARIWDLTRQVAVIVEPGTSEGWRRILAARDQLIGLGAEILAPCPHHSACPVAAPDWCHFSVRVARSRQHRLAKGGTVPWEDEKFIYLVAARMAAPARESRILAPPARSKAGVTLKLCRPDGRLERQDIARRDGKEFKAASKRAWGDLWNL